MCHALPVACIATKQSRPELQRVARSCLSHLLGCLHRRNWSWPKMKAATASFASACYCSAALSSDGAAVIMHMYCSEQRGPCGFCHGYAASDWPLYGHVPVERHSHQPPLAVPVQVSCSLRGMAVGLQGMCASCCNSKSIFVELTCSTSI